MASKKLPEMDALLTEVKAIKREPENALEQRSDVLESRQLIAKQAGLSRFVSVSLEQIIQTLKSQPSREQFLQVLNILDPAGEVTKDHDLDIRVPSPATAHILQLLVSTTIPTHWSALNKSPKKDVQSRAALLRCLRSVGGLNSILAQLRILIIASRSQSHLSTEASGHVIIRDLLTVLSALLMPADFSLGIYKDISALYSKETQRQVAWKEFVTLVASSKVLSTATEAISVISLSSDSMEFSWVGDGPQYAAWLGRNILHFTLKVNIANEADSKAIASLFGRSLKLGYPYQLVENIHSELLISGDLSQRFTMLLNNLHLTEQLAVINAVFRSLQKTYFGNDFASIESSIPIGTIGGVVTLCSRALTFHPHLLVQVVEWLSNGHGGSIQTIGLRRALVVVLAEQNTKMLKDLLLKCFEKFGDKLYIKHTPILVQNANAQVLLLAAGCFHRLEPVSMEEISRSSIFLNSISNRLAASSTRSRFLGMVVGMAISELVEKPGQAMKFDLDELDTDEAKWYLSLVNAEDEMCDIDSVKLGTGRIQPHSMPASGSNSTLQVPVANSSAKIMAIEEVDDPEEEDDDLLPYENPDVHEPSDSEDDPTLIQRIRPTAPLYIHDLISCLKDTDNVDRFDLALKAAPSLIRRKTGFGTELLEHAEELGLVLVGLQDVSKNVKFDQHKLQSMIALIVAQPTKMGRWFAFMYFDGDLSQAQRSSVLTALGLGARELAGHGKEDALSLGLESLPDATFPTNKLSSSLESLYLTDESPVASLTKTLSRTSLQPLAAHAADALSGPNVLKVRTFSSRMEVEQKRRECDAQRQQSTIKDLHRVLSEGFFFPLKSRFEMMMIQFSSTAPLHTPFLVPHTLTLFLQTLTLVLSTMGPNNPFLATVTDETLGLLLSLHTSPVASEPSVLAALLSMFLAVVDLNVSSGVSSEERLVTQFATQTIELREWAGDVFDRTPSVRGAEASLDPQEHVRTLAAGVLMKLGDVLEKYQGRLMGISVGFQY